MALFGRFLTTSTRKLVKLVFLYKIYYVIDENSLTVIGDCRSTLRNKGQRGKTLIVEKN